MPPTFASRLLFASAALHVETIPQLRELHQQFKIGIVIVEHDIETISSLCQRVVVLNFGALLADGTPREVFDHPDVIASYTGEATHA